MSRSPINRSVIATGLVVLMVTMASAQQPGQGRGDAPRTGPPSMGKVGLAQNPSVQEELQLDEEQKAKIGEIGARLREAIGEQPTDRERMQAFNQTLGEEEKKLDEVLKEVQQKRLNEISLQNAGIRSLFRENIASKLDLSDEQKEKLQGLLVEQREQAQRAPLRGNVAAIRELRQQWQQQLIAVLSEDQQKKWEELKGEPFDMRARFRVGGGAGN